MSKRENYKGVLIPRLIDAGQEIDDNPDDAIRISTAFSANCHCPARKRTRSPTNGTIAARRLKSARASFGTGGNGSAALALRRASHASSSRTSTPKPSRGAPV